MKKSRIISLLLMSVILGGCGKVTTEGEGLSPGEVDKWNDPNFDIIGVGAYNYTDSDIYDVFILPPEKNDIKFAAGAGGWQATPRNAESWWRPGAHSANFAWDYRWPVPRKLKVWWLRIIDMEKYSASAKTYDKYKMKATQPGTAWCEGEITIQHAPKGNGNSELSIHYYPDGHIEGDVTKIDGDASKVDIRKRDSLPTLDSACVKEVPNPYFGKKKPINFN